jgi:predicted unusual protein kinase regulating ubiquinone biosynthesis (AarF/ABC1/UbiB family)
MLESVIGALGPSNLNSRAVFEEVRARFREELDYSLEARHQLAFSKLHAGDPQIVIPRVITERSSRRVLTSELVTGKTLEAAALEPEAQRRQHCETLWRFVFKGNLVGGMFNADPHPGNYLFGADGRITFLDFGCVQLLPPLRKLPARAMHRAAVQKDDAKFYDAARQVLDTRGGTYEERAFAYSRKCFAPLFDAPFRMTREYVRSLVDDVRDMKQLIWKKDSNFVPLPEGLVFLNRLQFGFYSVLARLDAEVDYAQVEREFLSGID